MRHGTSGRRQRNRGNGGRRGGQPRMQVYDSNGPDVRIRGTAHQVAEKYMTLAKDAASSGDESLAENYLQHAEHYQRIISSWEQGVRENREGQSKQERSRSGPEQAQEKKEQGDDLSLPASILGESSQEKSKERTPEMSES